MPIHNICCSAHGLKFLHFFAALHQIETEKKIQLVEVKLLDL